MWLGSCKVRPRPKCSGLNNHVNFGVCLFLTGVRVVPEPSDTSTTNGDSPTFAHLFGHLVSIYNEGARLFGQSSTHLGPRMARCRWVNTERMSPDTSTTNGCTCVCSLIASQGPRKTGRKRGPSACTRAHMNTRSRTRGPSQQTQVQPMVVLVWLGSCTVRARPRPREDVRVLTSMFTSVSACFSEGSARCPNLHTQVRPMGLLVVGSTRRVLHLQELRT